MPKLAEKYKRDLDWDGKVMGSCIHCHMIGDALRSSYRDKKEPVPDEWVFPMPSPETIGMTLAADQMARVLNVLSGSLADKAGVQAGDDIVSLAGQPMVSTADITWALHRTGDNAQHELRVKRGDSEKTLPLALPSGWRKETDTSGRASAWSLRGMAAGGLKLVDLTDSERQQRGLGTDGMALWVKGLGMYNLNGTAKKVGFQKDDVLIQVAGIKHRLTESRLHGHLMQEHLQGEKVAVKVLRGGKTLELMLPMQ